MRGNKRHKPGNAVGSEERLSPPLARCTERNARTIVLVLTGISSAADFGKIRRHRDGSIRMDGLSYAWLGAKEEVLCGVS